MRFAASDHNGFTSVLSKSNRNRGPGIAQSPSTTHETFIRLPLFCIPTQERWRDEPFFRNILLLAPHHAGILAQLQIVVLQGHRTAGKGRVTCFCSFRTCLIWALVVVYRVTSRQVCMLPACDEDSLGCFRPSTFWYGHRDNFLVCGR